MLTFSGKSKNNFTAHLCKLFFFLNREPEIPLNWEKVCREAGGDKQRNMMTAIAHTIKNKNPNLRSVPVVYQLFVPELQISILLIDIQNYTAITTHLKPITGPNSSLFDNLFVSLWEHLDSPL